MISRRVVELAVTVALVGAWSAAHAAGRTYVVTLRDMAFTGVPARAAAGDVIEWVNADLFRHTATARGGGFDVDLPPKARARTVLSRPGVVSFYCRFHPGMTGRIQVARPGGKTGR